MLCVCGIVARARMQQDIQEIGQFHGEHLARSPRRTINHMPMHRLFNGAVRGSHRPPFTRLRTRQESIRTNRSVRIGGTVARRCSACTSDAPHTFVRRRVSSRPGSTAASTAHRETAGQGRLACLYSLGRVAHSRPNRRWHTSTELRCKPRVSGSLSRPTRYAKPEPDGACPAGQVLDATGGVQTGGGPRTYSVRSMPSWIRLIHTEYAQTDTGMGRSCAASCRGIFYVHIPNKGTKSAE